MSLLLLSESDPPQAWRGEARLGVAQRGMALCAVRKALDAAASLCLLHMALNETYR